MVIIATEDICKCYLELNEASPNSITLKDVSYLADRHVLDRVLGYDSGSQDRESWDSLRTGHPKYLIRSVPDFIWLDESVINLRE